jgi:cytoskeletal protein CcmA (bactofilin family)
MWKRDEAVKPTGSAGPGSAPATPTSAPPVAEPVRSQSNQSHDHRLERSTVNIGKSVVIKGELNGSEDLTIEGQVEGKIELRQNVLTIGPNGKIKAQLFAKSVIILGEVVGNVTATEKVDIRDNGSVDGDIASPRVAIAEGAHFRGSVDMQRKSGVSAQPAQAVQAAQSAKAAPQPAAEKPSTAGAPPQAGAAAGHRVGA